MTVREHVEKIIHNDQAMAAQTYEALRLLADKIDQIEYSQPEHRHDPRDLADRRNLGSTP